MSNIYDYRDAGMVLFGLNGVDKKGNCECGNPECTALFKHPRVSNWQHVPFYSDEQFSVMHEVGQFKTGFGVLVKDIFVVDVDARNGGLESYARLCADLSLDLENEAGFVVETGSADGSMHIYFKAPEPPKALRQSLDLYKGIDFKSSGFVVGAGSRHKSGNLYEVKSGYPQDLTPAPDTLIDLLIKKTQVRASDLDGSLIDVEINELEKIVSFVGGGDDYYRWRDVGLALHHTTSGSIQGLGIWDAWALRFDGYKEGCTSEQWSKMRDENSALLSLGSLIMWAKESGYSEPVVFSADTYVQKDEAHTLDEMIAHIDIRKPPKFAGQLCTWINNQCRYPRENLAAAATLYVLSCVGGMRHFDAQDGMSLNFMPFGIAGSSSGKEAIFQAIVDCLAATGLMPAVHGSFKSEQEAVRNLLRHQASFYLIDELGIELKKISQASQKGGASYLAGLIGFFMKAYSKADGIMPVSGDLKEEIKDQVKRDIARVNKQMSEGETPELLAQESALMSQLRSADSGIVNPFFNMFGLTTPVTFDALVDHEMATNGFIARSAIFREHETNPRRKKDFKSVKMDMGISLVLSRLYGGGETYQGRIERVGDKQPIKTTDDAVELLEQIDEYFYLMAENHKSKTGLEAICRRGWEICSKISLLTGMPSGTRSKEDVLYGFAVAKWDVEKKIELAYSNEAEQHKDTRGDALLVKIKSMLDKDNDTGEGVLFNRLKKFDKVQINEALAVLVKNKVATRLEVKHPTNGKVTIKYRLA